MTTAPPSTADLRRIMVERLTSQGALRTEGWRSAFAEIPREAFVPGQFTVRSQGRKHTYTEDDPNRLPVIYSDASLLTQFDAAGTATSSSTQPWLMANMLESLDVEPHHKVLEVGLGTGYNAALLCHRLHPDRVFSIDIDPELVRAAATRVHGLGYSPTMAAGDGREGLPTHAPYDRLIATFGVGRIPAAWCQQVRPGGLIVANVGLGIARLVVAKDHTAQGLFHAYPASFMTARDAPDVVSTTAQQLTAELTTAQGKDRTIQVPAHLTGDIPQFLSALLQPSVVNFSYADSLMRQVHCIYDPASQSWARITMLDVRLARLDYDGPRDLWGERAAFLNEWVEQGRPALDRYGLTVTSEGDHTLWLDSPTGPSWPLPSA
ncbi:methyltransferase domain-containing protein [Streptomyces buecherae]|uniref:Protein-L-isoaspartate O-methyltransferase n=1 Tax=Streptomyces buecherae TaxID=2763006 RepID=A0A7H8N367_9ACTN|nr:methyltransferase domain-containing protein [Streptomyces buecherae]QKW48895.1 methyltransferase domain-containing protein [Streptomyces buecherae]